MTAQRRAPADGGRFVRLDLRWALAQISGAIDDCARLLGGIDWLVISGGTGAYMRPLWGKKDTDPHAAQSCEQIATNLLGPAWAFEAAAGHLIREPGEPTSRVLYIGSTIVKSPPKALAYYAASKAGAEAFFRSEARRWAGRGIRVNVLATGWSETPMTANLVDSVRAKILRAIAVGRMAEPAELAAAALGVLEGPDYYCGDVIPVSGGI